MIVRHSSSFLFSLVVHLALAVVVLFAYKSVIKVVNKKEQEIVCVKLSNVVIPKKEAVVKPKKTLKQKITKPKPRPKKIKPLKSVEKIKPPKKVKPVQKPKPIEKINQIQKPPPQPVTMPTAQPPVQLQPDISSFTKNTPPPTTIKQDYVELNLPKIRQLIGENLYYPRSARRRGIEGRVIVEFVILKDGGVENIHILSSNKDILSRATIKTIQDLSFRFPKPKQKVSIKLPIDYVLH